MNKKGETFGCLVGIFGVVVCVIGLLICIVSGFWCIELDYSEEQRNACETNANFVLIFGFLMTIGSLAVILFSAKILGYFANNKG